MKYAIIALLVACRLPHVDPLPRAPDAAEATLVQVDVICQDDWGEWPGAYGTGVIISERHVLTAAHVVECPLLPDVRVTLPGGRKVRMVVDRDDRMFGSGRDLARLEIYSAERFGLGIAPPALAPLTWEGPVYMQRPVSRVYGTLVRSTLLDVWAWPGESGSPVYTEDGLLTGILVRAGSGYAEIQRISPYWLEGT